MAKFAESNPLPQTQSFIGLSQGTSAPKADESMGTLFKGLGNLIDQGTKVLDQRNEQHIEKELYAGIDPIRDAQGGGAVLASNNGTEDTPQVIPVADTGQAKVPPQINSVAQEIQRLSAARNAGRIGETYYYSKLEALTREVRTRYPGYREEIDKKVSSIVGTTPANALRKSIAEDLSARETAAKESANKVDNWFDKNAKYLPKEDRDAFLAGDRSPELIARMRNTATTREAADSDLSSRKAQLDYDSTVGKVDQDKAFATATQDVNNFTNRIFNDSTSGIGNLTKKVSDLAMSGKLPTPDEVRAIRGQFAALEAQFTTAIDKKLTEPLGPNGKTYTSLIGGPEKAAQIRKQALERVASLREMLVNGDYGQFAAAANDAKARENHMTAVLLEQNDSLMKIKIGSQIMGPGNAAILFGPNGPGANVLNDAAKAINNYNISASAAGMGNFTKAIQDIKDEQKRNGKGTANRPYDPAPFLDFVDRMSKGMSLDSMSPDALKNFNKDVFSTRDKNILSDFTPKDQLTVWQKLSTPEVTKNMLKLRESDPESWDRYKNWVGGNFYPLNKQVIDTLADLPGANRGFMVQVVPETGMLKLIEVKREAASPGDAMLREPDRARYQRDIDNFNKGIQVLTPIYGADKLKMVDALDAIYARMGLSVTGDKKPGNGEAREGRISLGGTIQLSSYTAEDNGRVSLNMKDDSIDLEAETADLINLSAPEYKGSRVQVMANAGKFSPILDLIGSAEAPKGYNQIQGNNRMAPLEDMTISEVYDLQRRMRSSGSESTAVGRYQFLRDTLKETVDKLGLDSDSVKFTREVQDQLAVALVGKQLQAYTEGRINADQLADALAGRWAGLPLANGRSKYEGVGSNRATTSRQRVLEAIGKLGSSDSFTPIAAPTSEASAAERGPGNIYGAIPAKDSRGEDQTAKFLEWNPDPVGLSPKKLAEVHPDLQTVYKKAVADNPDLKMIVASGKRGLEDQKKALKWGWSKTLDSDHIGGEAMDLWVLNDKGQVVFDKAIQQKAGQAMLKAAADLGIELDWGGNWRSFKDLPHFGIKKKK